MRLSAAKMNYQASLELGTLLPGIAEVGEHISAFEAQTNPGLPTVDRTMEYRHLNTSAKLHGKGGCRRIICHPTETYSIRVMGRASLGKHSETHSLIHMPLLGPIQFKPGRVYLPVQTDIRVSS